MHGAVLALVGLLLVLEPDTMTASNFERALVLVLKHEGGFVHHRKDPGGATNKGVTQRVYNAWRTSQGSIHRSVKLITESEIRAIYRRQYWDAVRADELAPGVDYAMFDYAVNSGPSRAIKDLQKVLKVSQDGHFGIVTFTAVRGTNDTAALIDRLCDTRMRFLTRLRHWETFRRGWTRRVAGVRSAAIDMTVSVAAEGTSPDL